MAKNYREQVKKVESAVQKKDVELPDFLVSGDKKYKYSDIKENWTVTQQRLFDQVMMRMYSITDGQPDVNINAMLDPEVDATIFALTYIEENENDFQYSTFNARKKAFLENLKYDERLEDIKSFFISVKASSTFRGIQSFGALQVK